MHMENCFKNGFFTFYTKYRSLSILLIFFACIACVISFSSTSLVAGVFLLVCSIFICTLISIKSNLYRLFRYKKKKKQPSYPSVITSDSDNLQKFADQPVKMYIEKLFSEIKKETGKSAVIKKSLLIQLAATVLFAVSEAIFFMSCSLSHSFFFLTSIALIIYTLVMNTSDRVSVILKKSKQALDTDIIYIIENEQIQNNASLKKWLSVAVCGMFLFITVALSVYSATQTTISGEPTADGYIITAFSPAINESENITVPGEIDGYTVTEIGESAFSDLTFTKTVTLPDTVKHISSYAFKNCTALESITLPEKLQTLGGEAFKGCSELKEITIPRGVTEIRGNTFEDCTSLKTVNLHNDIIDIHAYAFMSCSSLSEITLPEKITEIHAYTFEGCRSLEAISIPDGVTRIAAHSFNGCTSLKEVSIPDSVKEIGSSAFRLCENLREIYLPAHTVVNEKAFKESPTKIHTKTFTDEETEEIWEELKNSSSEIVYIVYDKEKGSEEFYSPDGDNRLLISNTIHIKEKLADNMAIFPLDADEQLRIYLEKARDSGITGVNYGVYSEKANEINGKLYIIKLEYDIDTFIESIEEETT